MDNLENLIQEYFNHNTNTDNKKHIEQQLTALKADPNLLPVAKNLLSNNSSQYAKWYALSVIEDMTITWDTKSAQDRVGLRRFLWSLVADAPHTPTDNSPIDTVTNLSSNLFPAFVLNKLYKLIVSIAKRDYPELWPDFFEQIYNLRNSHLLNCLSLFKTTVQEFSTSRDQLLISRQSQIQLLLHQHTPDIILLACQVLNDYYQTSISPEKGNLFDTSGFLPYGMEMNSPTKNSLAYHLPHVGTSPSNAFIPPESPRNTARRTHGSFVHGGLMTNETKECCTLALEVLLDVISWIPLTDTFRLPAILEVVFKYAQLIDNGFAETLGSTAMGVLIELLQRKYIPKESFDFLVAISTEINELLRYLVEDETKLASLSEEYPNKVVDLVGSFISEHLVRIQDVKKFPLMQFLEFFFRFTFSLKEMETFVRSLLVWDVFLEYIIAQRLKSPLNESGSFIDHEGRYQEALLALSERLLSKIQVSQNPELSELLNFDGVGEERGEGEWKGFIYPCTDLIAKITEIYPSAVLENLFNLIKYFSSVLLNQEKHLPDKIQQAARDVNTLSIIFGKVSHLFVIDANINAVAELLGLFINVCKPILESNSPELTFQLLIKQLFGTFGIYIHWISDFYTASRNDPLQGNCDEFLTELLTLALNSLNSSIPGLPLNGSFLLVSISSTVKPDLINFPIIQEFLGVVNSLFSSSSNAAPEVKNNVYRFITNVFVLPVGSTRPSDEDWNARSVGFQEFLNPIVKQYFEVIESNQLNEFANNQNVKIIVLNALEVLTGVTSAVANETTNSKDIVYNVVGKLIPGTLKLFEVYFHDQEILPRLFEFVLTLFNSLKKQISRDNMPLISETVHLFLQMMTRGDNLKNVIDNGPSNDDVLEKFILFLSGIVQEPGKVFEEMLPDVINFTVADLYPKCFNTTQTGLEKARGCYYDLVSNIIVSHWRYFIPSSVNRTSKDNLQSRGNLLDLKNLLLILCKSFGEECGISLEVFKQNIAHLLTLNERFSLFQRDFFKDDLMIPFLEIQFRILLERSHDLIKEEIVQCCSKIILQSREIFSTRFIPLFLQKHCSMIPNDQQILLVNYFNSITDETSCVDMITKIFIDLAVYKRK